MLQALSTVAFLLFLVKGDSPAKRDVYRFVPFTRRPTKRRYVHEMARSDRYSARPTSQYAEIAKRDNTRSYGIRSDGTRRPTSRRYSQSAKGDGFLKYFRRYLTRRPTSRYNAKITSDSRYRPTQRPTPRRYGVQGDSRKTQRPTNRKYGVEAEQVVANDNQVEVLNTQASKGAQQAVAPEPEVMDKKYFYVKSRLVWNDAQQACARRGAQLATIHSMDDHMRVRKTCRGECWLGAERTDEAGSFKWADDSVMNFEKWGENEPRHEAKAALCVKMSQLDKKWISADCNEKIGFVCQKMKWNVRIQASMDGDYFTWARNFARGGVISLALMLVIILVIGFLMCNYLCVVINQKRIGDVDTGSDEKTPLLWSRA